jgi:hypothetical protein
MRKQVREMVTGTDGTISNSKVWSFIGSFVATWIVIYMTIQGKMDWEVLTAYLGTVGGFSQISKWISYRYQQPPVQTIKSDEGSG